MSYWLAFVIIVAITAAVWMYANARSYRRTHRFVMTRNRLGLALCGFLVVYLLTQLLWSPLSGFRVVNNRGNHWFTNPWSPFWPSESFMGRVVFVVIVVILVFATAVIAFALRSNARSRGIALCVIVLVVLVLALIFSPAFKRWMWIALAIGLLAWLLPVGIHSKWTAKLQAVVVLLVGLFLLVPAIWAIDYMDVTAVSHMSAAADDNGDAEKPSFTCADKGDLSLDCEVSDTGLGNDVTTHWEVTDKEGNEVIAQADLDKLEHTLKPNLKVGTAGDFTVTFWATKGDEQTDKVSHDYPVAQPAAACANGFIVKQPGREDYNLNDQGAAIRGAGSEEAFRQQIITQAAEDPLTLYVYYINSPAQKTDPLPLKTEQDTNPATILVEGGDIKDGACYSQRAVDAYNMWLPLWKVADLTHQESVTHQGANYGIENGQLVQDDGVNVPNEEGVDIAYRDANGNIVGEHSALYVCTQPTTGEATPGVPQGHTNNQEVEQHDVPTGDTPEEDTPDQDTPDQDTPEEDTPDTGKHASQAPVSSAPVATDPRVNPNAGGNGTRPSSSSSARPTQAPQPQPTMSETPSEVQQPVPAGPVATSTAVATGDPAAGGGDSDGDGIPD